MMKLPRGSNFNQDVIYHLGCVLITHMRTFLGAHNVVNIIFCGAWPLVPVRLVTSWAPTAANLIMMSLNCRVFHVVGMFPPVHNR